MWMFYSLFNFYAQRRLDGNDKAGNIIQSSGAEFLSPMSSSAKTVIMLFLLVLFIAAAYITYRIIVHIWRGDRIS